MLGFSNCYGAMASGSSPAPAPLMIQGFGARTKTQTPCLPNSKEQLVCVTSGGDYPAIPTQRVAIVIIGCPVRPKPFRYCSKVSSLRGLSHRPSWHLSQVIVQSCGAQKAMQFFGHLTFVLFRSVVSHTLSGAFWSMKQPSPNTEVKFAPLRSAGTRRKRRAPYLER